MNSNHIDLVSESLAIYLNPTAANSMAAAAPTDAMLKQLNERRIWRMVQLGEEKEMVLNAIEQVKSDPLVTAEEMLRVLNELHDALRHIENSFYHLSRDVTQYYKDREERLRIKDSLRIEER